MIWCVLQTSIAFSSLLLVSKYTFIMDDKGSRQAHFVISALLAGNEKADELAKAGAVCDNTVAVLPPKIELKSQIKEHFYSDFTEYDGARMGKQFYFGPDLF